MVNVNVNRGVFVFGLGIKYWVVVPVKVVGCQSRASLNRNKKLKERKKVRKRKHNM